MRPIRIVQVGDIHYPDWDPNYSPLDAKDGRFSPDVQRELRLSSLETVLGRLSRIAQQRDVSTIVFMGDFTTAGKKDFLAAAVWHMTKLCQQHRIKAHNPMLAMVPGNHDVNREDAAKLGAIQKFDFMADLARAYNWLPMPIDKPVYYNVNKFDCHLHMILINTSVGSWELHNLPEALRPDHTTMKILRDNPKESSKNDGGDIARPTAKVGLDRLGREDSYYGQLDTPYFSRQMLIDLIELLQNIPNGQPCMIVAHHNILPQTTPRITPYAELLNSGYVRRQLLKTGRTIIFLHGHIHEEKTEVLTDPSYPGARLIMVSAPTIIQGFNEIVFYSDMNGALLGIRIEPTRVQEDGTVSHMNNSKCLFIPTIDAARLMMSPSANNLFNTLKTISSGASKGWYWSRVIQEAQQRGLLLDETEIEEALIMLFAGDLVEIDGLSNIRSDWRVTLRA